MVNRINEDTGYTTIRLRPGQFLVRSVRPNSSQLYYNGVVGLMSGVDTSVYPVVYGRNNTGGAFVDPNHPLNREEPPLTTAQVGNSSIYRGSYLATAFFALGLSQGKDDEAVTDGAINLTIKIVDLKLFQKIEVHVPAGGAGAAVKRLRK